MITQIIDATGDGVHALDGPVRVALDGAGNVYVVGANSNNAFKIVTDGDIVQIIDSSGSGGGDIFTEPVAVTVQGTDVYVLGGSSSRRGYKMDAGGAISKIIEPAGDGQGNQFQLPGDIAADGLGNVYVADRGSQVFKISP